MKLIFNSMTPLFPCNDITHHASWPAPARQAERASAQRANGHRALCSVARRSRSVREWSTRARPRQAPLHGLSDGFKVFYIEIGLVAPSNFRAARQRRISPSLVAAPSDRNSGPTTVWCQDRGECPFFKYQRLKARYTKVSCNSRATNLEESTERTNKSSERRIATAGKSAEGQIAKGLDETGPRVTLYCVVYIGHYYNPL